MPRTTLIIAVIAVCLSAVGFSQTSIADEASARREDQLKAAYLLNFVKFVEWPDAAFGEPLRLCFLGAASVRDAMAAGIESQRVGTRALAVRAIEESDKTDGCSVLYFDENRAATVQLGVAEPRLALLTVSDAKAFARNGGIIELFTDHNHLRFIINVDNARRAGLRVSSDLLQLAAAIQQAKSP
jgi:hypothetical protein